MYSGLRRGYPLEDKPQEKTRSPPHCTLPRGRLLVQMQPRQLLKPGTRWICRLEVVMQPVAGQPPTSQKVQETLQHCRRWAATLPHLATCSRHGKWNGNVHEACFRSSRRHSAHEGFICRFAWFTTASNARVVGKPCLGAARVGSQSVAGVMVSATTGTTYLFGSGDAMNVDLLAQSS